MVAVVVFNTVAVSLFGRLIFVLYLVRFILIQCLVRNSFQVSMKDNTFFYNVNSAKKELFDTTFYRSLVLG